MASEMRAVGSVGDVAEATTVGGHHDELAVDVLEVDAVHEVPGLVVGDLDDARVREQVRAIDEAGEARVDAAFGRDGGGNRIAVERDRADLDAGAGEHALELGHDALGAWIGLEARRHAHVFGEDRVVAVGRQRGAEDRHEREEQEREPARHGRLVAAKPQPGVLPQRARGAGIGEGAREVVGIGGGV